MTTKTITHNRRWQLPILLFALLPFICYSQAQEAAQQKNSSESAPDGAQVFASSCSGCHGLDGTGSERAPNIVSNPQIQRLSTEEISHIVSRGVPGKGMPSFEQLGNATIGSVVAYLRVLQGRGGPTPLPGDPDRGKKIFFASGSCAGCHMVAGEGGFIGPDLTAYSQTHTVEKIKAAITNPSEREPTGRNVTAVANDGTHYEGLVVNEDNFSLQLQSTDGVFHFFSKADLKKINRAKASIMPADYGIRLSGSQLNDLVSFLISAGKNSAPAVPKHQDEE
jgi:cytochrome c oxidase cbb3-type subunit III